MPRMITKIKWTNVEKLSAIEARSSRLGTWGFFESAEAAAFVSDSPSAESGLSEAGFDEAVFEEEDFDLDFVADSFSTAMVSGAEFSGRAFAAALSSPRGFARGMRVRFAPDSPRSVVEGDFEPLDCDFALGDDFLSPAPTPGVASGRISKPEPLSAAKFSPMKAPLPVSPAYCSVEIDRSANCHKTSVYSSGNSQINQTRWNIIDIPGYQRAAAV